MLVTQQGQHKEIYLIYIVMNVTHVLGTLIKMWKPWFAPLLQIMQSEAPKHT